MAKSHIGLDIGSAYIKAVQLAGKKNNYKLVNSAIASTPANIQSESEIDRKKIAQTIKKLVKDAGFNSRSVALAVPESQVFSRVIEIPELSKNELASAMKWEAEQYIPIPLQEATLDWQVIDRPKSLKNKKDKKMTVFLVACPTRVIERYMKLMDLADLRPISIETELIVLARVLLPENKEPSVILHVGSSSADIAIVVQGDILFSRSVPTGGQALTRAVATTLDMELAQAEEYKNAYGLNKSQLEGKVFAALEPVVNVILSETSKAITFFQNQNPVVRVKSVVLSGGIAKMPEVSTYFANQIGLEVQIGDPFQNIQVPKSLKQDLASNEPIYAVAAGLAIKDL